MRRFVTASQRHPRGRNNRPSRHLPVSCITALALGFSLSACSTSNTAPDTNDSVNSVSASPSSSTTRSHHDIDLAVISDFHGHIENAAKLDAAVDKIRADNPETHLVSVGDNVGGSAYVSAVDQDNPTMDILKSMGLEVTAVGNHEFDRGFSDLKDRIQPRMGITILAANVTPHDSLPSYEMKDYNGLRVAYVGAVTRDMNQMVSPSAIAGLGFSDPSAAVNAVATRLKDGVDKNGEADVVVALIHEDADKVAALLNNKVDLAFAGHSHIQKKTTTPSGAPLCEPINYGTALVHATIDVAKDGKVTASCAPVELTDAESPDIKKQYEAALERAKELGNKPVGYLDKDAKRGSQPGELKPGSDRGTESPASNLIAEVLWRYGQTFPEKPDLGMMNPGGVRADYLYDPDTSLFDTDEPGLVTLGESNSVQPFGNSYAFKTYTGAQLYSALEQQWQGDAAKHSVLRLGLSPNVEYTFTSTPTGGKRIQQVFIDGALVPNNNSKTYTVASNSFLLQGSDGFTVLGGGTSFVDTGVIDNDAFNDYLSGLTKDKPLTVDYSQRSVGIANYTEKVQAGNTVTIQLSSLAMTAGEPAPEKVTVTLCHGSRCVTGSSSLVEITADNLGPDDAGTATVTLTVPKDFPQGEVQVELSTSDGTNVSLPHIAVTS